jgi:hypothetical protein
VLRLRADAMTTLLDDVPLPSGELPASALSCFAYPEAEEDTPTLGTDSHVDRGLLTLVMASPIDTQHHLQVSNGVIRDITAAHTPCCTVVSVGLLISPGG